nr:CncC [Micromelalopha troglodyta]
MTRGPDSPTLSILRQSLMRSMSVEQRWQDLASLLTIPPPPDQYQHYHHHHHQHPHNISAHGAAGGYGPNHHAPLPPPAPEKHPDAYGATAPIDGAYKVESARHSQQHDGIYYQNPSGEMAPPPNQDGLLQSILNDEDLQLMDMAMNEGMYTMRMLDSAASHHAPHPNHTHMMMTAERDSASDSAVSSMGSERVPSLSDGEWCDGSDSAQEFHSSKFRPYDAAYPRERSAPHQPPQKKHHMFGKRCFQEQQPAPAIEPVPPRPGVVKYEPEQTYHHEPMHNMHNRIPLEVQDIINLPMDEFNERLSKHVLSEAQLSLIRDIRRRGKNKVAAQNCRKRKLDQITSLADEVRTVRDRKHRTQREHSQLLAERQRVKERFASLYRHVFQNLRDPEGRPLSSAAYSLQQAADGNVVLVPKMPQHHDHPMNRSSDDEMDRKAKHYDQ